MKSFLNNIVIFIFMCVGIYAILYMLIPRKVYSIDDYEMHRVVYKKLSDNGIKRNILIGDSKPQMGLNAKFINGTNFSVSAVGPIEGYDELRQIIQNKTNHIDTLFISYSLRHLISQDGFYKSSYYYNLINPAYLDSARQIAMNYNDKNYNIINSSYLNRIIKHPAIIEKTLFLRDFILGGLHNIYEYFLKRQSGKLFHGNNQFVNGRVVVFPLDSALLVRPKNANVPDDELINTNPSIVNRIYLQKMIMLANTNNIKVIFILMPSPKSKATEILKKQIENLRTIFKNDLVYDDSFYKDVYFRDAAGHLNIYGVNKFQTFLYNKLYSHTYR